MIAPGLISMRTLISYRILERWSAQVAQEEAGRRIVRVRHPRVHRKGAEVGSGRSLAPHNNPNQVRKRRECGSGLGNGV